jgi:hypothetical protein
MPFAPTRIAALCRLCGAAIRPEAPRKFAGVLVDADYLEPLVA